jgi:hypothetical protein
LVRQGGANPEQHKGEPKLPFNVLLPALFIIEGRSVIVFVTVALYCCFWRSPSGIKSKRIFLSADPLSSQGLKPAIQPERVLPEGSFIVLCPVARWLLAPRKSKPSPKKSVSCVSAVLFLLCQSRFVLFLLCCCSFYSCYAIEIAEPVPTFKNPYKSTVCIFWY